MSPQHRGDESDRPLFPLPHDLADDSHSLVANVAALARDCFRPRAAIYDRESRFPDEDYEDLHRAHLLGLGIDRAYGGAGADSLTRVICLMEIAKADPSLALTFNMHLTAIDLLSTTASEEQKRHYFSAVVQHGARIAAITSEPGSSFRDRFQFRTVFEPVDGQRYRIRGKKHFCSLGDRADYYFVSGLLRGSRSAKTGMLSAMIPRATPGIRVAGTWEALGMRATNSLPIDYDCVVEEEHIIGPPGKILEADWSGFALGYGAVYLGNGMAAYEHAVDALRAKDPASYDEMTR